MKLLVFNGKIGKLKKYFKNRKDISLAFLFGSQANETMSFHSDWDIGVYFKPQNKNTLEWEDSKLYPQENEVWGDLERIVGKEVDMAVLNRVPSSLVFTVLNKGIPLYSGDRSLYLRLLEEISYEAIDFREFCNDFYKIKQRSMSLSAEDKARLLEIVDFLAAEAEDFKEFSHLTWQEYQDNRAKRREVERWVENIVNASLDIAKIILASQKKDIPATYQETLRSLGITKIFDVEFAERFSQWARLRNILAYRYLDLKWGQIERFIKEASGDVRYLVDRIKSQIQ